MKMSLAERQIIRVDYVRFGSRLCENSRNALKVVAI
ncbi:hypothetical protein YSA_09323 [Pseudomonas putida ND6]|uniref:Uncharacterized protein n=1 Tax=Pseudomonas putida ND6 TaxID=231023 RepID=I3V243_PSEPU|nr:hypothetical protein YSA_09323 [Pseudomonas putida ND6]